MRGTWQIINGVFKGISEDDGLINGIAIKGITVTDKQQIADEFGKFSLVLEVKSRKTLPAETQRKVRRSLEIIEDNIRTFNLWKRQLNS